MKEIIEHNKIKLSFSDKLRYYRLSLILLVLTIVCFTNGFTKYSFDDFNTLEKISLAFLTFTLVSFYFFYLNLTVKIHDFPFNKRELINKIENIIASNHDWELLEKSNNHFIIKTKESLETLGATRNLIISPNTGNRIYIGLKNNQYFVKSIFNLSDKNLLVLNNGESKRNEKIIIDLIKLSSKE
ncbi:hypothetical protein [Tenacibaculum ascidiaceicola]|uniref:hypothetical protein n=1 Tax=Tenacibaculum ascidiaceicola TaxID=1699411 RepID=UPI003893C32E